MSMCFSSIQLQSFCTQKCLNLTYLEKQNVEYFVFRTLLVKVSMLVNLLLEVIFFGKPYTITLVW
jgi:hypothetical protein